MKCDYAGRCGGCSWINKSYEEQKELKQKALREKFDEHGVQYPKEIKFFGFEEGGLRDRVDLSLRGNDDKIKLGLFDLDRSEILDLESCPQMSENLEEWFLDFRKNLPKIKIASIRLRVSPDEVRGVWLDLPNETVRDLLDEADWLEDLSEKAEVIEIGQRRKRLVKKEGKWKLGEPFSEPWFETYVGEELEAFPIKLNVGGFSQPGFKANRKMIEIIHSYLKPLGLESGIELCAGSGNLSFAISSLGINLVSTELDKKAVENASLSLKESGREFSLSFTKLNAHKPSEELKSLLEERDLLVVDPPRSGMRGSLEIFDSLEADKMPRAILYVSCFLPSLAEDLAKFQSFGYQMKELSILDQFSHSPHGEYVVLLIK